MNFQPVINSLLSILTEILNFLPHFVNGLIILIVGYLISALIRWIVRMALSRLRFDQLADRVGITNALRGLGVRLPLSLAIAQIVFFFLLLSFVTEGVRLMGLTSVVVLLQNVLIFIPKAISAAIILIFGSMLARFLGDTVKTVASNVNISYSKALGKLIEITLVAFVAVLAVSTLGVDTTILTTSLTIIVAAGGLAIALTFAFGARDAARNVIAGHYIRQNFSPGQQLILGDYQGRLRSTSGAYTVLETDDGTGGVGTISLPNSVLLEHAVLSREKSPSEAAQQPPAPDGGGTP